MCLDDFFLDSSKCQAVAVAEAGCDVPFLSCGTGVGLEQIESTERRNKLARLCGKEAIRKEIGTLKEILAYWCSNLPC